MKTILFIASVLITTSTLGQDILDKYVSTAFCNCLSQTKKPTEENLSNCFQEAMKKHSDLLLKECMTKYKDTSYETGYKFGQELYARVSVSLIFTCKPYYKLIDTIRYSYLQGLNKDSVRTVILAMNKTDQKNWGKDFFTQRGVLYFQTNDLDSALKDFDSAIKLDQLALQSIYFKAWTLEINKNYDEAILLYSNLATMTKKNDFNIFAAIAKRKKNGQ
jgi:tetratricopeptide (TPR) repeat protein